MKKQFPDFLSIHLFIVPKEILKGTNNFLVFNLHFFSIGLLLQTLFTPWKRQYIEKEHPGFDLTEYLTVLSFNLISRGIGFFIRLCVVVFALFCEVFILAFGIFFLVFNFFIPLLTLKIYSSVKRKEKWEKLVEKVQGGDPLLFTLEFIKSPKGIFVLTRLGISPEAFSQKVLETSSVLKTEPFVADFSGMRDIYEMFFQLCEKWTVLKTTLDFFQLKTEDVNEVLKWYKRDEERTEKESRFWEIDNLLKKRALGIYWSYGYTINLDKYSINITDEQSYSSHLVGRDKEVAQIENILSRDSQSNVIVVGEEGVGKKTIILQLANNIRQGAVNPVLKHKRVLEVDINAILGEGKDYIASQNTFQKVITEAHWAGNIILLVPSLDRFVASGSDRIDLTPVFEKYAPTSALQIIGLTTPDRYQKYIYPNPGVAKFFSKVEVEAPSLSQAVEILENFSLGFEKKKGVLVTFQAIKEAVEKADRYITDIPFPEKAIDLLDEAIVSVSIAKGKVVTSVDIDRTLSEKTKIPMGEISKEEKDKLLDLEKIIHERLIDQEEAVSDLANAFRRTRLQLGQRKKPAGVFMFLGPTGVGKTETAKALAEAYFGSEEQLVRLDMNEFQDEAANVRLLGYFEKNEPGIMIKLLRENPFCVLLLDEIEKASKAVLNLFLTAFDEGYVTDNFGKKISLQEMIIIGTSNAGAEFIRQRVTAGEPVDDFKKEFIDFLLRQNIFSPEFLNRFDSIVVFKPLSKEHLNQIARLQLQKLNQRLLIKKVKIKITDELVSQIVEKGFDPVFGARPIKRLIQDQIEAPLAGKLLRGEVAEGAEVEFLLK